MTRGVPPRHLHSLLCTAARLISGPRIEQLPSSLHPSSPYRPPLPAAEAGIPSSAWVFSSGPEVIYPWPRSGSTSLMGHPSEAFGIQFMQVKYGWQHFSDSSARQTEALQTGVTDSHTPGLPGPAVQGLPWNWVKASGLDLQLLLSRKSGHHHSRDAWARPQSRRLQEPGRKRKGAKRAGQGLW